MKNRKHKNVRTVYIRCGLDTLIERDPKDLYRRALLPSNDKEEIEHFTGISSPFDAPIEYDLLIDTDNSSVEESVNILLEFVIKYIRDSSIT